MASYSECFYFTDKFGADNELFPSVLTTLISYCLFNEERVVDVN